MKGILAVCIVTASLAAPAFAEPASFETQGFPLSLAQMQILAGSTEVKERVATADSMMLGMPASPVQAMLLTPRSRKGRTVAAVVK